MTKKYVILRKKLEDLESHLSTILSFPPHNPVPGLFVDEFDQKLAFICSLLGAEVASRPSKPHHLEHIRQRLHKLTDTYHAWLQGLPVEGDADSDKSTCSCTESCLNDDGEAAVFKPEGTEIVEYKAGTALLRDWHGEEERVSGCLGVEIAEDEAGIGMPRGGDRRVGSVKLVGFVGFVAVVVMMITVFGWSEFASRDEHFERFLVPT